MARLKAERSTKAQIVGRVVLRVAERYRAMVERLKGALASDPDRGWAALQDAVGPSITL